MSDNPLEPDEQQRKINRYVAISSILHALLFLAFTIGTFFSPKPLLFMPTMQIDVVALPSQVKNSDAPPPDVSLPVKANPPPPPEEAKPDPEQLAKPEPQKEQPPEPKPEKVKPVVDEMALEQKKEADAKKRAEAALKKMREQLKKERAEEEHKKQAALDKRKADLKAFEQKYRQAINGNTKNQGTSLTGQMKATQDAYVGAVQDRIASNWALPSFLNNQGYHARIVIRLDGHGNVISMRFTKVSGNKLFDDNAEGAIRRSSPLPPPPAELLPVLNGGGMEVKFPFGE